MFIRLTLDSNVPMPLRYDALLSSMVFSPSLSRVSAYTHCLVMSPLISLSVQCQVCFVPHYYAVNIDHLQLSADKHIVVDVTDTDDMVNSEPYDEYICDDNTPRTVVNSPITSNMIIVVVGMLLWLTWLFISLEKFRG